MQPRGLASTIDAGRIVQKKTVQGQSARSPGLPTFSREQTPHRIGFLPALLAQLSRPVVSARAPVFGELLQERLEAFRPDVAVGRLTVRGDEVFRNGVVEDDGCRLSAETVSSAGIKWTEAWPYGAQLAEDSDQVRTPTGLELVF